MMEMIFSFGAALAVFGVVGMALCSLEWLVCLALYIISLRRKRKCESTYQAP